jgi:hypothetical protein
MASFSRAIFLERKFFQRQCVWPTPDEKAIFGPAFGCGPGGVAEQLYKRLQKNAPIRFLGS